MRSLIPVTYECKCQEGHGGGEVVAGAVAQAARSVERVRYTGDSSVEYVGAATQHRYGVLQPRAELYMLVNDLNAAPEGMFEKVA